MRLITPALSRTSASGLLARHHFSENASNRAFLVRRKSKDRAEIGAAGASQTTAILLVMRESFFMRIDAAGPKRFQL